MEAETETESVEKGTVAAYHVVPAEKAGEIDAPLLRVPGKVIHRVVDAAGKPSVTRYQVLRRLPAHTWLRLRLMPECPGRRCRR